MTKNYYKSFFLKRMFICCKKNNDALPSLNKAIKVLEDNEGYMRT